MADTTDHPPIRYSVDQRDFSFDVGSRLRVFLDGAEQELVRSYGCEAGKLVRLVKTDDQDGFKVDADGRAVERETLHGNVTVEWRD